MIHCVINLYAAMDFLKPQLTSMTHVQLKHDLFMKIRVMLYNNNLLKMTMSLIFY